jgi:hypothetical protein
MSLPHDCPAFARLLVSLLLVAALYEACLNILLDAPDALEAMILLLLYYYFTFGTSYLEADGMFSVLTDGTCWFNPDLYKIKSI